MIKKEKENNSEDVQNLIQKLVTPSLWRAMRIRNRKNKSNQWKFGAEQPPEFYDEKFRLKKHWQQHYTESHYFPIWAAIGERIRERSPRLILDVGCGCGQFANLLFDRKIKNYIGIDFSPARIEHARRICPKYQFEIQNAITSSIFGTVHADCVLMLEFLEHIKKDRQILEKIPKGILVIATLPNFAGMGHVRHFKSDADVEERYNPYFSNVRVDEFIANKNGKKFFILQGER